MISLLLATILSSVPQAIERTELSKCASFEGDAYKQCVDSQFSLVINQLNEDERIAVNTWKCFNRTLVGGAADLFTTSLGLATRDDLKESNPLGFNTEARVALKAGQIGLVGWGCYVLEKNGHKTLASTASWSSLTAQVVFAVRNLILTFKH